MAQAQDWRDQGYILLEIELIIQAEAFAPAARLYQANLALLDVGQVVAQEPALDSLGETDRHMWLLLATQAEPGVIEQLLNEVTDLAEFHIVETSDISGSPTSAAASPMPTHLSASGNSSGGDHNSHRADLSKPSRTVRISVERLDTLLNLVGELVTNRTRLLQIEDMLQMQHGKNGAVSALSELTPHISHVVNQLQEEVMHARMLPIAHLFNKFPRLVREVARQEGKQVNLVIEGETTELDRAVIEAIGDPLMHLLRNAVDHGIETSEVRLAAGKSAGGTVRLTAEAAQGQIVITVADDGRGIDPVQIRQAAVERGLLSEEEATQLSDEEATELIFRPNLSTASRVTEVSGRGVGMDVVRTNIERLSGSVIVTSEPGTGTTFRLTLPLTLALVQTMLVAVRDNLYAIPVTNVDGSLYVAEANVSTIKGRPGFDWQGAVLPLLDLREFFIHPRLPAHSSGKVQPSIVLVTWGKLRVGLVVDKIMGQQEIVVKALSPLLGHLPGLSGATILGDGRIALIVDIPSLLNAVLQNRR
jgi:two-component system chemotaxis sensor kinase CheA